MSGSLGSDSIEIREVWNYNLEKEMKLLQEKIDEFPCVAMDTEFPGTIFQTNWDPNAKSADNYEPLKNNVNNLKLIQLGLTLTDRDGNLPSCETDKFCIWQFNFREFDKDTDPYNSDSLKLLTESGIDFPKFKKDGVDSKKFGELLMNSGLVLEPSVEWVTFQGGSDFGYLMKILKGNLLPETHSDFLKLMETFSPVYYDVKHLMKYCGGGLHGGLSKVADNLDVKRVGISHQAGSDSLLTSRVFTEIKRRYFNGSIPLVYSKILYGLGADQ